jgi:hypothetical protein
MKLGAIIPKKGLFTLLHTMCRLLAINIYEMNRSLAEINFHLTKRKINICKLFQLSNPAAQGGHLVCL